MKYLFVLLFVILVTSCNSSNKNTSQEAVSDYEDEMVVSLGDWQQGYYKDEFGDATDIKLVYQQVAGTFHYNDTDKMDMTVDIIVDEEDVFFRLKSATYEAEQDDITFSFKDENGSVTDFQMIANKNGYISAATEEEQIALRELLYRGGVLKVVAEVRWLGSTKTYNFTFNADDLENALNY
jgi:hypothetical protein